MTSRERILAAINHRETDRVPVDLGSTPSSGISAIAYNRLKVALGLAGGRTLVYDVVQQLAEPEEPLLDRFGADVLDIGRAFNTDPDQWYAISLPDGSQGWYPRWFRPVPDESGGWTAFQASGKAIARMPEGGTFFDQVSFPYLSGYPDDLRNLPAAMSEVLWSALVHSPWDHAGEPGFWDTLRDRAIALRASSDRALMVVCGCNLFEWGTFLRRADNFLMDLLCEPRHVHRLLDALMEIHLTTLENVCRSVGDVADILRFGDDLGMDQGPLMSPSTYRTFFKHRHAQLCAYVRTHSRMHTFLHSCGSIAGLLPDLIEAGFEVINPVQTGSCGMDPVRLKREFGRDLTFWGGGVDTRAVLNRGTSEEVQEQVRRRIDAFLPGGGFVFNPVHNILPDVPPGNIIAMFDAVRSYGGAMKGKTGHD